MLLCLPTQLRADKKHKDAAPIDVFVPGDQQSETSHQVKSENSGTGVFNNKSYRDANNGWFSYTMKVDTAKPLVLVCTYWGGDAGRSFDVLIDDKKIATQQLTGTPPNQFFDVEYDIPTDLVVGKSSVVVTLKSAFGSFAGGLFGSRVSQAVAERTQAASETPAVAQRTQNVDPGAVDSFIPGDQQSELSHQLKSENSGAGAFNGRTYRDANNGWFSFALKVDPSTPLVLVCTYWGGDSGRTFDVLIDDKKIATQQLTGNPPNQFFEVKYDIPADLMAGKSSVVVALKSVAGSFAGGLFESRVVKMQ